GAWDRGGESPERKRSGDRPTGNALSVLSGASVSRLDRVCCSVSDSAGAFDFRAHPQGRDCDEAGGFLSPAAGVVLHVAVSAADVLPGEVGSRWKPGASVSGRD